MSEANIRAAIHGILSGVANVGTVYAYQRWAADWETFIQLFKTTISGQEQIRGWELARRSAPAQYDNNAEELRTHNFVLRGFQGLKDSDATELIFNAQIEAVCAAFRLNQTLNGLCEQAGPVSVDLIDTRSFGSVLCHHCKLILPAAELYGQ